MILENFEIPLELYFQRKITKCLFLTIVCLPVAGGDGPLTGEGVEQVSTRWESNGLDAC